MDNFKIASANVQGLGNFQKRKDVFQFLRQKKFSVYFLQDTHFVAKNEKQIRAEWGYECFFASYTSQSRGVAILFNNNFDFKVTKMVKDENGNYLIVVIKTMDREIALVNVYGPNNDNPQFYSTLQKKIEELGCSNIVIGGDWNLVLNPVLDYCNYRHNNNVNAQEKVIELAGDLELVDVWREINPELLRYTWRRPTPRQQARLDFFLISDILAPFVKDTDIQIGYRSDHSIIITEFEFKQETQHRNYWKFNSSLLKDKTYVDKINDTINRIKEQYAALVYSRDKIKHIPSNLLVFMISDQLFLDVLLMEIRKETMDYSSKKKKETLKLEKNLEQEIQRLDNKLNKTEDDFVQIQEKKQTLIDLRKNKIQGIIIRSKARYAAEGEQVSKYYCGLEKRHFVSKQMYKLITDDSRCITKTEEMIHETKDFYQKLYSKRNTKNVNLEEYTPTLPKLSKDESDKLEGPITLEEASHALKNMNNGKSPGTDGITVDFLKFFWRQIGSFVVRSLNQGFINKEMSISQREGIIVCLPKGDKPREYLKNWRPISLLNVTYKIGSSCIANRIKTVLPSLIDEDQTGFMSGRYIGDNLRLLYDVIHYLKENDKSGLLVSIDFEKAFDSVDWNYMNKVLKLFGFGETLCQWILAFYTNIKTSVIVNGQASTSFSIERGCRQGDPISPYLFILCAEILACKIRENEHIKGINIHGTECKVSQFADDTSFLLEGDKTSFQELFLTLHQFEEISGLKVNFEKTCNVWLGNKRNSETRYLPNLKMSWNPTQFKILGLWFTNDLTKMTELNINDKFNETKKLFTTWMKRSSTPIGRVAILKSLILSKLVYLWIMLPNPPEHIIQYLQKKCYAFVWDNKNDKVKRTIAVHSIQDGGINIPHIVTYIKSLKLTWLKKALRTDAPKWKRILTATCPEVNNLEDFGPTILKKAGRKTNVFWKDVFSAYIEYFDKTEAFESEEFLREPLFSNNKFKIDNKPMYFENWVQKGILYVKHLINDRGNFLSLEEFSMKYDMQVPFLEYHGCVSSVKKYMRINKINIEDDNSLQSIKAYSTLVKSPKGAKTIYNILIGKPEIPNACKKWINKLNTEIVWKKVFLQTKKIREVKLKWFQMKINYRVLVTNSILRDMGVRATNLCNFCNTERDTIIHYLWQCRYAQSFWVEFERFVKDKCYNSAKLSLNPTLVLFGNDNKTNTDEGFDHILLIAKFFIYKCKISNIRPALQSFKYDLAQAYKIDKYVQNTHMNYEYFVKKWAAYVSLLD
jgi:exonuclease III